LATGVLLLVLGQATRLSSYLMAQPKVYCAEVVLGATTATDDAEAPLQTRSDASAITLEEVQWSVQQFTGTISQIPPRYAAVKRGGEKLYVLARRGVDIAPAPRRVTIYELEIVQWRSPRLRLRLRCSSGTYVRALARDIGAALEVGGYLHALRRVSSGRLTVGESHPMEALDSSAAVEQRVLPADWAVLDQPAAVVAPAEARGVRRGQPVRVSASVQGTVRLYDRNGTLVALGQGTGDRVKPFLVFDGGQQPDADGQ
jgi:tRNA pseudouridine55 synthase